MSIEDPNAQGTQAGAEGQSEQTQEQVQETTTQVSPGVQARLDELTAHWRETQRANEKLLQQNNELLAQLALRNVTPAPAEEPLDIDPDELKKLDRFVQSRIAPLQKELEQARAAVVQQQRSAEDAEADSLIKRAGNPAVERRAQELLGAWANHPVYRNATKLDAVKMAIGEMAVGSLGVSQQQRNERGQFATNSANPVVPAQAAPRQQSQGKQSVVQVLESIEDLNSLSYDQLVALNNEIDKEHPNGIPLVGGR